MDFYIFFFVVTSLLQNILNCKAHNFLSLLELGERDFPANSSMNDFSTCLMHSLCELQA